MKSIFEMSPAEVVEEGRRRTELRARGARTLSGEAKATIARKCAYCRAPMASTDERCPACFRVPLETHEQADVIKLYLAYGCRVYSTSQKRAAKVSEGIPDLIVFSDRAGRFGWHETKRSVRGSLSPAQIEFQELCASTGTDWGAGGLADARRRLVAWGLASWVNEDGSDIEPRKST